MPASTRLPRHLMSSRLSRICSPPLALILVLFQTFHGSLLQAQHIAQLDFSITEIRAQVAPAGPMPGGVVTADTPLVANHDEQPAHGLVSETRRAEVLDRAAVEQYHFRSSSAGRFTAANPAQRLNLLHQTDGLTVSARPAPRGALELPATDPSWSMRLQSLAISFDDTSRRLDSSPATPAILENQSSVELVEGVTEWFINQADGIKHGYTIEEPVTGRPRTMAIRIATHTDLTPVLGSPGAVEFRNAHGTAVAIYRGLHVFDHHGNTQPSTMALEGATIVLRAKLHDAAFPVTVDPVIVIQQGNSQMASDGAAGDEFGASSAGCGDFTAFGAPHHGNGKVYIQHRNQGGTDAWGEQASIELSAEQTPGGTDLFGFKLAMGKDEATGTIYLAIGAPEHGGCGAVFIYIYVLGAWTFLQKLAPNALTGGDRFGCSLAMSGIMLAVGASAHRGIGAVFLFALGVALFTLAQTILSPSSTPGNDFGFALAFFGLRLLIGAPGETVDGFTRAGVAYLYTALVIGGLFPLSALKFFSAHAAANDEGGSAVAVNNDSVAIAFPGTDGWPGTPILNAGLVLIFGLVAGLWGHRKSIFGNIAGGLMGHSLSMNHTGDIAISAPGARTTAAVTAGLVFLYLFNPLTLAYGAAQKILPTSYIDPGMFFGASVLLLGTLLFATASNYNVKQGAFFRFLLTATAVTFATWQLLFWTQAIINNPALLHIHGATADPDRDGLPNFLEYLLGLNPTIFNRSPLTPLITSTGLFQLVFPLSLLVLNAVLILQYSLNFTLWQSILTGPLAAFFSMRILHPGIQAHIMILTIAIAAAGTPNINLRYRAEER